MGVSACEMFNGESTTEKREFKQLLSELVFEVLFLMFYARRIFFEYAIRVLRIQTLAVKCVFCFLEKGALSYSYRVFLNFTAFGIWLRVALFQFLFFEVMWML